MAPQEACPKDISASVRKATPWSEVSASEVAEQIVKSLENGSLEWDRGAGEDWITILDADKLVGFVYVRRNLAMLCPQVLPSNLSIPKEIEIVEFTGYDGEPEFAMEPGLIQTHFGVAVDVWKEARIDPKAFNANDLWFMTI